MRRRRRATFCVRALAAVAATLAACVGAAGRQQQPAPAQGAQPAVEEWRDDFDGEKLDETKWERYTFEGGGGKAEVREKQLRLRGGSGDSRSGVRSRQSFAGDRFFVQAHLTKVGERAPQPGEQGMQVGTAILTVLFGGSTSNRIEWLLRSDGIFEAWVSVDGRMERIDNRQLATRAKSLWLGVGRKGDQLFLMVNDKVALERQVRGMGSDFKVMLYGFGTTESSWDAITVQTMRQ
jgi:hypothetical protein